MIVADQRRRLSTGPWVRTRPLLMSVDPLYLKGLLLMGEKGRRGGKEGREGKGRGQALQIFWPRTAPGSSIAGLAGGQYSQRCSRGGSGDVCVRSGSRSRRTSRTSSTVRRFFVSRSPASVDFSLATTSSSRGTHTLSRRPRRE